MRRGPVPPGSGQGEDPAREPRDPVPAPDPMTEEDWQAWCDSRVDQDEPPDPDEEEDPDSAAAWECDLDAIVADCRRITAERGRGVRAGGPAGPARRAAGRPETPRPRPARIGAAGSG